MQSTIDDLDKGFKNFFANLKKGKKAGKYFVSILVKIEDYNPKDTEQSGSVGVDLPINA